MDEKFISDEVKEEWFKQDSEFDEATYKEVLEKLENSTFAEELRVSSSWKIFRSAWKKVAADASNQLAHCNPNDSQVIAQLQLLKRFYENVLPSTIEIVKQEGKVAHEQAKDKGWLSSVFKALSSTSSKSEN